MRAAAGTAVGGPLAIGVDVKTDRAVRPSVSARITMRADDTRPTEERLQLMLRQRARGADVEACVAMRRGRGQTGSSSQSLPVRSVHTEARRLKLLSEMLDAEVRSYSRLLPTPKETPVAQLGRHQRQHRGEASEARQGLSTIHQSLLHRSRQVQVRIEDGHKLSAVDDAKRLQRGMKALDEPTQRERHRMATRPRLAIGTLTTIDTDSTSERIEVRSSRRPIVRHQRYAADATIRHRPSSTGRRRQGANRERWQTSRRENERHE